MLQLPPIFCWFLATIGQPLPVDFFPLYSSLCEVGQFPGAPGCLLSASTHRALKGQLLGCDCMCFHSSQKKLICIMACRKESTAQNELSYLLSLPSAHSDFKISVCTLTFAFARWGWMRICIFVSNTFATPVLGGEKFSCFLV